MRRSSISKRPRCIAIRSLPRPTKMHGFAALWPRIGRPLTERVKPSGVASSFMSMCRLSCQAGVDDEIRSGAAKTLVGADKQRDARHSGRIEPEFERLAVDEPLIALGRGPKPLLAFSDDSAGHDAIDTDARRAELPGQRSGQAVDGGLCRRIADHSRDAAHPGD